MNYLIQGLINVYSENCHSYFLTPSTSGTIGNPSIRNPDIDSLQRTHRVHLARYGAVSLKERLITAEIVCHHAQVFWIGRN